MTLDEVADDGGAVYGFADDPRAVEGLVGGAGDETLTGNAETNVLTGNATDLFPVAGPDACEVH